MARVTIEDCTVKIPSRFELVVLAAQRAREISSGAKLTVERDNDKNPVVALREIAADNITPEALRELLIKKLQKHQPHEDRDLPEEDNEIHNEIEKEVKSFTTASFDEEELEEAYTDEADNTDELEE